MTNRDPNPKTDEESSGHSVGDKKGDPIYWMSQEDLLRRSKASEDEIDGVTVVDPTSLVEEVR